MEHYTLLLRLLFSTPYYGKDNIFVHVYCQKGWGVIKVCTVYYSTAVYSTILYYRVFIFLFDPPLPPGQKYDQMNCWWKKTFPYLQYCKTNGFNFSHAVRTPSF